MHFTVLIIGEDVDQQLEPFDQNLEVEPYVGITREEMILNYKRNHPGLKPRNHWTEDRWFECAKKEAIEDGEKLDPVTGEVVYSYNQNGEWDWYDSTGGRWRDRYEEKFGMENGQCLIGDIRGKEKELSENVYAAILDETWYCIDREPELQDMIVEALKEAEDSEYLTIVDCHV